MATSYSPGLIVVSILISMIAAHAALSMVGRTRAAVTRTGRCIWLTAGSVAMGIGIWSMHYLGMLAVQLPVPVYYYWPTVLLSLAMAVAASFAALMTVCKEKLGWRRLLTGASLMGGGIGAMHYIGMAAMRSTVMEHYRPWIVALSVVVAITGAWLALWIAFALRNSEARGASVLRLAGGCVMGATIAAMHYTAMSAAYFTPDTMPLSLAGTVRINLLGEIGIAATAALILFVALSLAALDKRKFHKKFHNLQNEHLALEQTQQALVEYQRQLEEANAQLTDLAVRDGLTGLYNRRHFDARLQHEWRRAARHRKPLAVLLIDIDFFKSVNDRFGHQRGDECLRNVAGVLDGRPRRSYDVVARYGGEEFIVLLPESDLSGATMIANLLRQNVEARALEKDPETGRATTVSIGVACQVPPAPLGWEALVAEADAALYRAKRNGRNRVEVATELVGV